MAWHVWKKPVLYAVSEAEAEEPKALLAEAGIDVEVKILKLSDPKALYTPKVYGFSQMYRGIPSIRAFIANAILLGHGKKPASYYRR